MKTSKLIFNLLILSVFLLLSNCSTLKEQYKDPIKEYEKSGHNISVEDSKTLYNNYNNRFKDYIRKVQLKTKGIVRDQYNPTEYVLVNREFLRTYLDFLDKVEQKNNGGEKKITGIAIFLGARSNIARLENKTGFFNKETEEYIKKFKQTDIISKNMDIRGRITTFLAPTYRNGNLTNVPEITRQIPFYIKPSGADKYVGEYKSLLDKFKPLLANIYQTHSRSKTNETTLNAEEFTDMPPKPSN